MGIAGDIAMIMVAALLGALVAQRLGLPLLLGYIVAGVCVGPNTGGPTVHDAENIELLADIGVTLLLFTVGLEFSIPKLKPILGVALGGTFLQVALTTAFGWLLGRALDFSSDQSLWLGALISLSSTMVAMRVLSHQGYSQALSGRVMMGILVVQDLAAIPMVLILPTLHNPDVWMLLGAVGRALGFVVLMLTLGAWLLPRLLGVVAGWNSRELFLITVVAVGLGVGYATYLQGLSFTFGAFLAGVVLSESDHGHQALGSVTPLRDLFGMLFFVSVGMLLKPAFIWLHFRDILIVLSAVMIGKGLILALVVRLFGYKRVIPLAVALALPQVGEFSFVLARLGLESRNINENLYNLILVLATLSMAVTPQLGRLGRPLYAWWSRRQQTSMPEVEALEPISEHVVVVGYGRVGSQVVALLLEQNLPCIVVELNYHRFQQARLKGATALFGDVHLDPVLEALQLEKARLVVLTPPDRLTILMAVEQIRKLHPELSIVSRATSEEHAEQLERLGVTRAVLPEREAALELARQALEAAGVTDSLALTRRVQRKRR